MGGQAELSSLPIRPTNMLSKFAVPLRGSIRKMAAIVYRPSPKSNYRIPKKPLPGTETSKLDFVNDQSIFRAIWSAIKHGYGRGPSTWGAQKFPDMWIGTTFLGMFVILPICALNALMEDKQEHEAHEAYLDALRKQRLEPPTYAHMNIINKKFMWGSNDAFFQHFGYQPKPEPFELPEEDEDEDEEEDDDE